MGSIYSQKNIIMEKTIDPGANRAVRCDHSGHSDVLYIDELPMPSPKAGEISSVYSNSAWVIRRINTGC